MANKSWGEGGGLATTHRNNSLGLKPTTEEFNRDGALASDADIHNIAPTIRNQSQHYYNQSIPLSSTFQIHSHPQHAHAATAAEIALGISSPFHHHRVLESELSMVAAHQPQDSLQRNPESSEKSADFSSVIASLMEVNNKDRDEEHTSRTSETGLATSPGRMTPLNDSQHGNDHPRINGMGIGTPSTVSTAPSTDDASFTTTEYRLDDSHLPNLLSGTPDHGGSPSWGDDGLLPGLGFGVAYIPQLQEAQWPSSAAHSNSTNIPWSAGGSEQQRVASFRDRAQPVLSPVAARSGRDAQQQHSLSTWLTPPQYPPRRHHEYPGQVPSHYGFSHGHQQPQGHRTTPGGPPRLPSTPPRPRNARQAGSTGPTSHRQPAPVASQQGANVSHTPAAGTSSQQRSSSEILKTLLRKKACLYEPDTSRAVALVTWLVGRELALNFGFFSRQQLQSGVHACVSDKIESGVITRTKVNRCMQIILNSCFHYIIPRSDGTEEKGDAFVEIFSRTVQNDALLLHHLPAPWNDLHADPEFILEACLAEEEEVERPSQASTPKSSPRLTSTKPPSSPGVDKDAEEYDSKRSVLLCFNENVRCAEDVARCHNEFIRDTANAAHLQLTAQEWWNFFGREASRARYLWGNIGIPVPSPEVSSTGGTRSPVDAMGQMSEVEVCKFRTSWCAKRYEHDHDLCGFAHVEVGGGWLRRNPAVFEYTNQMCPFVFSTSDKRVSSFSFFVNECPKGVHCDRAHSLEEILYHPLQYKTKSCTASATRVGWCKLGGVCPNIHPAESSRPANKKSSDRSHPRHPKKNDQGSTPCCKPAPVTLLGSPMVYASPAPFSNFDRHLVMPGLQCLFRRHCSVIRAHVYTQGPCKCVYNCFGDDLGIKDDRPKMAALQPTLALTIAPGA
jgi:hypothetical protein